jgi:hypothetical protein
VGSATLDESDNVRVARDPGASGIDAHKAAYH